MKETKSRRDSRAPSRPSRLVAVTVARDFYPGKIPETVSESSGYFQSRFWAKVAAETNNPFKKKGILSLSTLCCRV